MIDGLGLGLGFWGAVVAVTANITRTDPVNGANQISVATCSGSGEILVAANPFTV